jgi:hypothetical protein
MKRDIVDLANKFRIAMWPSVADNPKACLYHAMAMHRALCECGFDSTRVLLQAGSATWRVVSEEADDGVSPTHYSYVYEGWPDLLSMPEVHVWVAVLDTVTNEVWIVDTTVQYVKQLAEEKGLAWAMPEFPPFFWCRYADLPKDCHYEPDKEATWNVMQIVLSGLF